MAYTRGPFGRGLTGSPAIVLGDMLGNHQLGVAASLNGRINETFFLAQYVNLARRLNWAVGITQQPYFYYEGASIEPGTGGEGLYVENIRRLVVRQVQGLASYPFSRFRRLGFGLSAANVQDDLRRFITPFDPATGQQISDAFVDNQDLGTFSFVQPSVALVFDNSLFGGVGPLLGRRSRFEVSQRLGQWRFTTLNADYRRYDHLAGPFTLATRLQYYGQHGRDEQQFRLFAGIPEFVRGYTSGSFQRNECLTDSGSSGLTGCAALDQLIGTRIAMGSAELRWPLFFVLRVLPMGFPAIEGVACYDDLVAWEKGMKVRLKRDDNDPNQSIDKVRTPLTSVGVGVRANVLNVLILRADYAFPLQRPGIKGYWTLSLGPTF